MASDNFVVEESLLTEELANYFDDYSVSGEDDSVFLVTVGSNVYIVTSSGEINPDDWYGDGTATKYYIRTAKQLCELSTIVNNGEDTFANKTIYLTNDIDMTNAYDAGEDFTPIGKAGYYFEGTFNGNEHEISNFGKSESGAISAMFYCITGTIENLAISDSYFSCAAFSRCLGWVDSDLDPGTIRNCSSLDNVIEGTLAVGGIVGEADCTSLVECCINTSSISTTSTSSDYGAGGIVGCAIDYGVTIKNCVNLGTVTSSGYSGGILGSEACTPDIYSSYNTGAIIGKVAGGIEGYANDGVVYNCYNAGSISGSTYTGGLLGKTIVEVTDNVDIQNSYSTGDFDLIGYTDLTYASEGMTELPVTNSESRLTEATMTDEAMIDLLNYDIETDSVYIYDTNKINNGYPILDWQQ